MRLLKLAVWIARSARQADIAASLAILNAVAALVFDRAVFQPAPCSALRILVELFGAFTDRARLLFEGYDVTRGGFVIFTHFFSGLVGCLIFLAHGVHREATDVCVWLNSARLGSTRLNSAQLGSTRLGSARLNSAQLNSAQLGSTQRKH